MAKLTKNRKESLTKFETEKLYSLKEASDVVKRVFQNLSLIPLLT